MVDFFDFQNIFVGLQSVVMAVIWIVFIATKAWALIDCATRRPDAFPAVDRKSKGMWLAITGASFLTALFMSPIGIFGIAGIIASMVYLVDVRPRIAEITRRR